MDPGGGGTDGVGLRVGAGRPVAGSTSLSAFWGDTTGLFAVVFLIYSSGAVLSWASKVSERSNIRRARSG